MGLRLSDDDAGGENRFVVGALSVKGENVFCTRPRLCSSVCLSSFTTANIATWTSRGHWNIPFSPGHLFWKLLLARFIFKLILGVLTWKTFQFSSTNISMGKLYRMTLKRYLKHVVCAPGQNVLCCTQEHHQVIQANAYLRRYEIHVRFIVFTIICRWTSALVWGVVAPAASWAKFSHVKILFPHWHTFSHSLVLSAHLQQQHHIAIPFWSSPWTQTWLFLLKLLKKMLREV